MKDSLRPGLTFEFDYTVPESKTVPYLYPESEEFQMMPKVLATGFMIGLIEWACIKFINGYIDWPREQSVGIHVKLSHSAATPYGLKIVVKGELIKIEGRKLTFSIVANDGLDVISEGTHERFIVDAERFSSKVEKKRNMGSTAI
ncbi:thioesterase family protein [Desulfobacterota bacterium AH_259_B03_O07]|nr:thioesterase family protein [Desulfobacterota bacterium AH_259_B03_O07]